MMEKVTCPPKLKCGIFTTAAVDNIDHTPVLLLHMADSIELGSPCFNTQTNISVDLPKLLSQMILFPRGQ